MITHGTVRVTTMMNDSPSAYEFSELSSNEIDDDDDNYEENDHKSQGDDSDDELVGVFSPPATIDGEGKPSDGDCGSKDQKTGAFVDSIGMVFLPLDDAPAQKHEKAGDIAPEKDQHPPEILLAEHLRRGNENPHDVGEDVQIDVDTAWRTAREDSGAVLSGASSQPEFPGPNDRRRRWSGVDTPPTERVLTRLYEGHCFGEMALIYDEPRNASVQATTYTTCVYLHKDAFRKHLCDNAFNKLIEETVLKTAYLREQREIVSENQNKEPPLVSVAQGVQPWKTFASARALATVRGGERSSFRCTAQLKFAGNTGGETNGRLVNDYRVCEKVGEGSFGAVYKVVHVHSGEVNAMKVRIQSPRRICCH